tara:strand:- start:158 stop:370 length:213 start_codon:yes stop_codon:yes gene_type:complete
MEIFIFWEAKSSWLTEKEWVPIDSLSENEKFPDKSLSTVAPFYKCVTLAPATIASDVEPFMIVPVKVPLL